jgi:NAD(P)H-hydrate epimerase
MAGAVALAGMAALRGGAGIVTVACPATILDTVASFEPTYLTLPLDSDADGRIKTSAVRTLLEKSFDVVALGPGLGQSDELATFVRELMSKAQVPMVIDADALNLLARDVRALLSRSAPTILTPHPGEFSRLTGRTTEEIARDRIGVADAFARQYEVTLVLKGAGTVVTDGVTHAINTTGNPGLAKGGSGDVLTGLISAWLGQKLSPWEAARLAVHIHGLAADIVTETGSEITLIARDLLDAIPPAVRRCVASQ